MENSDVSPPAEAESLLTPITPAAPAGGWSPATRLSFRFAFSYLVLYILPFPLWALPGTQWLSDAYSTPWEALVAWMGRVLGISEPVKAVENGSGDRTFDYVLLLCVFLLAVLATVVWSVLDRKRRDYRKLHEWLRIYVRYCLAATMLGYGFAKVFKTQFPFPSLDRLMQPYGESSPMGLLWTFMGFSTPYTIFAGGAEALGGVLLFFRRTTTLGALVVTGVMTNVVIMNFSYDVPVKLYSSNLLLMALFLTLPDLRRLVNVLFLNRATDSVPLGTPFTSRWLRRGAMVAKVLLVGWILFSTTKGAIETQAKYGDNAPKPPLYGAYLVEELVLNGTARPPLITDRTRWKTASVTIWGGLVFRRMDDSRQFYRLETDLDRGVLVLKGQDQAVKGALSLSRPDAEHIVLLGVVDKDTVSMKLKKLDTSKFLLVDRGFHWVNEFPFNR